MSRRDWPGIIRQLRAKADSTEHQYPDEAASLRARADHLEAKHCPRPGAPGDPASMANWLAQQRAPHDLFGRPVNVGATPFTDAVRQHRRAAWEDHLRRHGVDPDAPMTDGTVNMVRHPDGTVSFTVTFASPPEPPPY